MKKRFLSTEEKASIVGLHQTGLKQREIAAKTGFAQSAILTVLQNWRKRGTVEGTKARVRPPKISERDPRSIGRTVMQNRRAPLAEITNNANTPVSPGTIRSALHEMGFRSRIAAKKPFWRINTRLRDWRGLEEGHLDRRVHLWDWQEFLSGCCAVSRGWKVQFWVFGANT